MFLALLMSNLTLFYCIQAHKVRAMPTFVLLKNGQEVILYNMK